MNLFSEIERYSSTEAVVPVSQHPEETKTSALIGLGFSGQHSIITNRIDDDAQSLTSRVVTDQFAPFMENWLNE